MRVQAAVAGDGSGYHLLLTLLMHFCISEALLHCALQIGLMLHLACLWTCLPPSAILCHCNSVQARASKGTAVYVLMCYHGILTKAQCRCNEVVRKDETFEEKMRVANPSQTGGASSTFSFSLYARYLDVRTTTNITALFAQYLHFWPYLHHPLLCRLIDWNNAQPQCISNRDIQTACLHKTPPPPIHQCH